jgi:hypothetical protein
MGARVVIGLVLLSFCLGLGGCDPFNRDEFKHELDTLHSTAAEGVLLSHQVAEGDSRTTFVRVHAGDLSDTADARVEKLHDAAVPDDLEHQVNEAISAGEAISSQLQDVAFSPGDAATATEAESKLRALTDQVDQIEAGL